MARPRFRMPTVLLLACLVTGCNRPPGAGGAGGAGVPLAPVTGVPGAPVSTSAVVATTGSGAGTVTTGSGVPAAPSSTTATALAGAIPSSPVTLGTTDSSGRLAIDPSQRIGVGFLVSESNAACLAFRKGGWAAAKKRFGSRVNFWELDVDRSRDQAQYLGWTGALPTLMVTRGTKVIQKLENATEALLLGVLAGLAGP